MEERPPRVLPLSAEQLEQRRIHEAHLARELAMYSALVWAPETRAAHMHTVALALRITRSECRAADRARFLARKARRREHVPRPPCLDHLTAAPRTGPPAGRGGLSCPGGALTSP